MNNRVLIISCNCFSQTSNNGKTLLNLFKNWKDESVYQFYTHNELPDFANNYNLFRITDADIINLKLHKAIRCGSEIKSFGDATQSGATKKHFFEHLLRELRDILWSGKEWYYKGLNDWVEKASPDLIFFVGLNNPYLYKYCIFLQKKLGIPVIIYVTDDYLHPKLSFSPFYWIRLYKIRKCFKGLANSNTAIITINEIMNAQYSRLFKNPCYILTNYVVSPFKDYSLSGEAIKKITYVGNLLHGRWKKIIKFSRLLMGKPYIIEVFPGNSLNRRIEKRIRKESNIVLGGLLDAAGVREKILSADYVLHVESFSYSDVCLARYSLSTKITEYAAFCRPIIAYCPREVASYKILKMNKMAICLDKLTRNELSKVLNDEDYLKEIVKNAYEYFDSQRKKYHMEDLISNIYVDLIKA